MTDMSYREFVAHMQAVEQAAERQGPGFTSEDFDRAVSEIEAVLLGSPYFVADEPDIE